MSIPQVKRVEEMESLMRRALLILNGADIVIGDKIGIGNEGTSPHDMEIIWELVMTAKSLIKDAINAPG